MSLPLPPNNEEQPSESNLFGDMVNLAPYERTMRNARIWLYVLAGLQAIMAFVEYRIVDDPELATTAALIDGGIALLFLGLALISKKYPVPSFTIALVFYLLIQAFVVYTADDPTDVFKGAILKVLLVVALVKANIDARKYERMKAML